MRNSAAFLLVLASFALSSTLASCGSSGSGSNGGGGAGGSGSGGSGGGGSGGGAAGSGNYGSFEAPHAPFPQVVYQGGPILTAPQIITVTFPGDTLAPQLESFGETLEASPWWSTVTAEYCQGSGGPCIGPGSAAKNVVYASAPASSYTDSEVGGSSTLREWLIDAISKNDLPTPETPTSESMSMSNTLYVLYFPTTTTIQLDNLRSCVDFDGFHGSTTVGSVQVAYAVVPECSGPMAGNTPPITTLQNTTITASHEIVEATTDPSDQLGETAWYLDFRDDPNHGWLDIEGGGEVADICIDPFLLDQDEAAEGSFTVQRIWSNANAAAGLDPCNPIPGGEVYFSAAPAQSYFVLDVGSSITFPVNAFSTAARSDWTLTVQDWSDLSSTTATTYLSFSIEGGMAQGEGEAISVNNGTTVNITMTLMKDPGGLSTNEADGSIITFSGNVSKPTAAHFWPFVVLTPADAIDAGTDATVSTGEMRGPPRHLRRRPFARSTSALLRSLSSRLSPP